MQHATFRSGSAIWGHDSIVAIVGASGKLDAMFQIRPGSATEGWGVSSDFQVMKT